MNKGILRLCLVLIALQLAFAVNASELTDDYFDIATNYFNSNNFAKSLEYLDLIIKIEPDNLKANTLRDKIAAPPEEIVNIVEENQAIKDNQTAQILAQTPTPENLVILNVPQADVEKMDYNSDYYNNKGLEFFEKKDFNTALEYFFKAIRLDKRNAQAYNNLAMAYQQKNSMDLAIKYFKKANSLNRKYTQPLVNLSNLYKQIGDEKSQLYYLNKAINTNPNDYIAYYWLGDYYRGTGVYPKAIDSLKESIKINPKYAEAYLNIAMCFFEIEEFNYTILSLNQYNELCPDSAYAFGLMGKASLALSRFKDAKVYIEKALSIAPNNEYEFELGKIDYFLEDYSAALEIFQNLLASGGASAEIFNYVGLCNYKLKNIDVAMANFNKAIQVDPLRPIYYYNLAQSYKSTGDKKNYVKYINSATKINPINYQDFIDLSYIYFDNGNASYAINSLNNAISKYPDVKSLYLSKLKIYEALGDNLHYNETKDTIEARFNRR